MTSKKTKKNILIITTLITIFTFYNFVIYTSKDSKQPIKLSLKASLGQQLWQNNNCWSCHQIYGLGGYLGPDLTNVYSKQNKGPLYIKAFLNSGVKAMPQFNFSEVEKEAIVAYLQLVDSTGYFPNYEAQLKATGWVEIKYKK